MRASPPAYAITALNEHAALVSFGNRIDVTLNRWVTSLHEGLAAEPFAGFIESAPAYSSLAVFYDPLRVASTSGTRFETVANRLEELIHTLNPSVSDQENTVLAVPVFYDGDDLAFVASCHGLREDEVVALHTSIVYRVFMIGFQPGFAYMGSVDERLATPRKSTPRVKVPAGSVGIAGSQTGIYPASSPGGWQLIGRTPIRIFNKERLIPCLFQPGNHVRYYAITASQFRELNEY
jgi:inhibitor of KinA